MARGQVSVVVQGRTFSFCSKCGARVPIDAHRCPSCRAVVSSDSQFDDRAIHTLDLSAPDKSSAESSFEIDLSEIDFGPTEEEIATAFTPKGMARIAFVRPVSHQAQADSRDSEPTEFAAFVAASGLEAFNAGYHTKELPAEDLGQDLPVEDGEAVTAEDASVVKESGGADTVDLSRSREFDSLEASDARASTHASEDSDRHEEAPLPVRPVVAHSLSSKRSRTYLLVAIGFVVAVAIIAVMVFAMRPQAVEYEVECIDNATGELITNSQVERGNAGESVVVFAPDVEGYKLKEGEPAEKTIALGDSADNIVRFSYERLVLYTVKYLDTSGSQIASEKNGEAPVGTSIVEKAEAIEGYTLTSGETSEIVLSVDGGNEISFSYGKNTSYTVRNVDENGAELSAEALEGVTGQSVVVDARDVSGYRLTSDASQAITLQEDPQANIVTFAFEAYADSAVEATSTWAAQAASAATTATAPSTNQGSGETPDFYLE